MKYLDQLLILLIWIVTITILGVIASNEVKFDPNETDYYRMLGVGRSADNREIRKAFKQLAIHLHPDKNVNDPNAHENFVKLNRAYEILKDEELRNIYNTAGEDGLKAKENNQPTGRQYHGWSYYYETFGIYDNDEQIVTLSYADFEQSVRNSVYNDDTSSTNQFIWFINFYSPQCSHCHHLAPEWRRVARLIGSIVRIGAVNCAEDRPLCQSEGIRSYPSLVLYPYKIRYDGRSRTSEMLIQFVLKHLNVQMKRYNDINMDRLLNQLKPDNDGQRLMKRLLIITCYDGRTCLSENIVKLLSYKLQNLLQIINLDCKVNGSMICEHFGLHQSKVALFPDVSTNVRNYYEILNIEDDLQDDVDNDQNMDDQFQFAKIENLIKKVLNKFPKIEKLNSLESKMLSKCLDINHRNQNFEQDSPQCVEQLESGWILAIVSTDQSSEFENFELKTLKQYLPRNTIRKLKCSNDQDQSIESHLRILCNKLSIKKYPTIVAIRYDPRIRSTSLDHYYGRMNAIDLLAFVVDAFESRIKTLTPEEFERDVVGMDENENNPTLVQFFAPWCPACKTAKRLLRKISIRDLRFPVSFGMIDCAVHGQLCRKYNIHSYPTVLLYNRTEPHQYFGKYQNENDLIQFIENTIETNVLELDPTTYKRLMSANNRKVIAIDFYSPYCQPCQSLAPIWRQLSNQLRMERSIVDDIRLGAINCVRWNQFCRENGVQSYPTIRLYPSSDDTKHRQTFYRFNEQRRDLFLIRAWLYDFLQSNVEEITIAEQFKSMVINSNRPTLVDFYAPSMFTSRKFEPDFALLSTNLTEIRFVRLNCQRFASICDRVSIDYLPSIRLYKSDNHLKDSWHGIRVQWTNDGIEHMTQTIRSLVADQININSVIKDEL